MVLITFVKFLYAVIFLGKNQLTLAQNKDIYQYRFQNEFNKKDDEVGGNCGECQVINFGGKFISILGLYDLIFMGKRN